MTVHDALGHRMKTNYEHRARTMLPRRTHTVVRLDGKAFHTYTRGLEKPFDQNFVADMVDTAQFLCENVQGCRLAYVQSDEISLVLVDSGDPKTEAWFDGNQQKVVSITASMATCRFNRLRPDYEPAHFDSRAFTIPDLDEVANYLIWRQQDATRNSVQMVAQANFSHRQLHKVGVGALQEMLWKEKGINWNNYHPWLKRGALLVPELKTGRLVDYVRKDTGEQKSITVTRRVWSAPTTPIFTANRAWLLDVIQGDVKPTPNDETKEHTCDLGAALDAIRPDLCVRAELEDDEEDELTPVNLVPVDESEDQW